MLNITQWPTFWSWKRSDNLWDWLFYIFGVCGDKHCTWWMSRLHIHLNIVIWTCIVILVFPVLPCQLWPCGIHLKKEIFNSVIHSHTFCNDGHGWRICFGGWVARCQGHTGRSKFLSCPSRSSMPIGRFLFGRRMPVRRTTLANRSLLGLWWRIQFILFVTVKLLSIRRKKNRFSLYWISALVVNVDNHFDLFYFMNGIGCSTKYIFGVNTISFHVSPALRCFLAFLFWSFELLWGNNSQTNITYRFWCFLKCSHYYACFPHMNSEIIMYLFVRSLGGLLSDMPMSARR